MTFTSAAQVQEREFFVQGRRLAARCWHDPALPVVLALHGWQDNAGSFDRLAPLLPDYHVIALDFAGHGLSDWRASGTRYHSLDHVDDVQAVMAQLGAAPLRLLGHSMGAGIALLLAAALPERVLQLALIDGLGPYASSAEESPQILRTALQEWQAFQERPERVFADKASAIAARQRGFSPLSAAAATRLCERGLKAVAGGFSWTLDRRVKLASPMRYTEAQVMALLAAIQAPVLLLRALQGFPGADAVFAARWAAIKHGEMHALPGGHHLHLDESPEAVAAAVNTFFARPA